MMQSSRNLLTRERTMDSVVPIRTKHVLLKYLAVGVLAMLLIGAHMNAAAQVITLGHGMPLPRPSRLDDPELARFVALRDEGERRREALAMLVNLQATHRTESNKHWQDMLREDYFRLRAVGMPEEDRALVLAVLNRELNKERPDWERVEWALIAAGHGFAGADALAEPIRTVLEYPRGEKTADALARSLQAGLLALGRHSEPAARALRDEASSPAFWEANGPIRNPHISTDPTASARELASLAQSPLDRIEMVLELAASSSNADDSEESPSSPDAEWLEGLVNSGKNRVDEAADALREELIAPRAPVHAKSRIVRVMEQARSEPLAPDDYDLLLEHLGAQLDAPAPDWNVVATIMRAAFLHGGHDDRMTALIRHMFEMPRPNPLPEEQWSAFNVAFASLSRVGTEESVGLLFKAMEAEFWETGGTLNRELAQRAHTFVGTDAARREAIRAVRFAPAQLAMEPLEAFRAKYPSRLERYDPSGVRRARPIPSLSADALEFWSYRDSHAQGVAH